MDIAEENIQGRQANIMNNPLTGMDAVFKQEFEKGEVSGITLFSKLVDIQIDVVGSDIQAKLKELENVDSSQAS